MSDQNPEPTSGTRRGTVAIIAALAVVIVAAVVVGIVSAQRQHTDTALTSPTSSASISAAPTSAAPVSGASTAAPTSAAPGAAATPSASAAPSAPAPSASAQSSSAAPAPQPTTTAEIAKQAVIVKALTAKVTKQAAVVGTAQGPGEIAGPSVQFTIQIRNTTGTTVDLTSAVVNAYSGTDRAPATQLEEPGGRAFPDSVRNGRTATGVFVFNIPVAQRGTVLVTLDTSVANAVVAFKGPAPR
ncbi:hypothetical protein [uncultured Amnibacterium sp.]|uniref:hypothetical protein n=1 Tax=uncultured Amnibacterium sp. TaxID=1631851 RepID=UPI0035CA3C94